MGERLTQSLAKHGHQVDVITHFPVKKPIPNYNEISLLGTLEPAMNNMNASMVMQGAVTNIQYLIERIGTKICNLLGHEKIQNLIKNPPKDPPYDLVIVELFMAPCFLGLGRHLNVPMVGVITSDFHDWLADATGNPHNPSFMPGLFTPYSQRMTFFERLMNTALTNLITMQMNYYMSSQYEQVKKYFGIDVSINELYRDVGVILVNAHHSVNGVKPSTTGVIEVGGLHISEDADPLDPEVKKWLDESTHGCVYFTFGSMMRIETFPPDLQKIFYTVFEKIAPVRVLMKIVKKEELLPGLPKNVMTRPWFSQVSVFKHKNVKVFISHGGLMGTQEAFYFGIPIVGIPLFGDQPTNLMKIANKNLGITLGALKNVTLETLSYALNTVLKNDSYRNNMKRVSRLFKDRPMSAVDTAIYWVEYVARNGNVLQSPAVHLSWWQLRLLDVYGFIIVCLVVVIYIALFLLRKLKKVWLFGCNLCSKSDSKPLESKKKK